MDPQNGRSKHFQKEMITALMAYSGRMHITNKRCGLLQVMKKREVTEMDGCKYIEVNDEGLVIERKEGKKSTLEVR